MDLSSSRKHTSFYSQEEGKLRRGECAWHRQEMGPHLGGPGLLVSCLRDFKDIFNEISLHFEKGILIYLVKTKQNKTNLCLNP